MRESVKVSLGSPQTDRTPERYFAWAWGFRCRLLLCSRGVDSFPQNDDVPLSRMVLVHRPRRRDNCHGMELGHSDRDRDSEFHRRHHSRVHGRGREETRFSVFPGVTWKEKPAADGLGSTRRRVVRTRVASPRPRPREGRKEKRPVGFFQGAGVTPVSPAPGVRRRRGEVPHAGHPTGWTRLPARPCFAPMLRYGLGADRRLWAVLRAFPARSLARFEDHPDLRQR